jgi:RNA polymerase sigma factor (sigma-70 family)
MKGPADGEASPSRSFENGLQEASAVSVDAEFSTFYREFLPNLVAFLLWHGASLTDAADVAQETMLKAYQVWGTIRTPRRWVRRVAARGYARRFASVHESPSANVEGQTLLLRRQSNVSAWEERHEILRLLAALPHRQRQVMAWTLDGYTPSEIAEELRITLEAVRSNLLKARRALAVLLANRGELQ